MKAADSIRLLLSIYSRVTGCSNSACPIKLSAAFPSTSSSILVTSSNWKTVSLSASRAKVSPQAPNLASSGICTSSVNFPWSKWAESKSILFHKGISSGWSLFWRAAYVWLYFVRVIFECNCLRVQVVIIDRPRKKPQFLETPHSPQLWNWKVSS